MLRIRADVNGHPIGWVLIHNTGKAHLGMHRYDAASYDPNTGNGVAGIEGIAHYRPWGWMELTETVLEKIREASYGR